MSTKIQTIRITLDLPTSLHTQIKTRASQKGETLKNYFITLAQENLNPKKTSKIVKKQMPKGISLDITSQQINQIISDAWLPKF